MNIIIKSAIGIIVFFIILVLFFYSFSSYKKRNALISANRKLVKRIIDLESKQDEIRQKAYDEGFEEGYGCGGNKALE